MKSTAYLRNETQVGGVLLYWFRTCIGYGLRKAFNDLRTLFNTDDPAIQRNMIVGGIAPFHIGVEAVVGSAALVLLLQTGLGRFLPLPVDPHDAVSPELHVRVDKDPQAVGAVLQDKIGAASYDDAGLFFRKLPDDPVLQLPEQVLIGEAEAAVGKGRSKETAGGVLSGLLDLLDDGAKPASHGISRLIGNFQHAGILLFYVRSLNKVDQKHISMHRFRTAMSMRGRKPQK